MVLNASEQQLFYNCAQLKVPQERIPQTTALLQSGDIRWQTIGQAGLHHGVIALLYKNFDRLGWEEVVQPDHRRIILRYYQHTVQHTLHLLKAFVSLLERFSHAGLMVIAMKGPDLVYRVYSDPTLRGFRDLDLLVQPGDLERARDLLVRTGYQLAPALHSESLARRYHFNLPFEAKGEKPVRLDLHWALTDRFTGYTWDIQGMWDRASATKFSGQPAWVLSLEDLLIYLAVHADAHGYLNRALAARQEMSRVFLHPYTENRLIWFVDLSELLQRFDGRIDWNALVSRAGRAGVRPALSGTFRLLNELLGPRVPQAILEELGSPPPSLGKRLLLSQLLRDIDAAEHSSEMALRWQALLAFRHGVQFRLVRLMDVWGYIFPSFEQVVRHHRLGNSWWLILHYPAHVVRAFASCTALAAELLFHLAIRPFRTRAVH